MPYDVAVATRRNLAPSVAVAIVLLFATWLGVNAVWGLTSSNDTFVSAWERNLGPLGVWVLVSAAFLAAALTLTLVRRGRAPAVLPAILLGYLAGVSLSRAIIVALAPDDAVVERSLMMLVAAPILAAIVLLRVSVQEFPLRFGRWNRVGALFGRSNGSTWTRKLGVALFGFVLPVAVFMQVSQGFPLITSPAVFRAIPHIGLLSLVNAIAEELLFRGLLQRPLINSVGVPVGIWLQAGFFGIHHWGSSPSLIAGLGMFPFLTLLGFVWGRATYETNGLGWSVTFHTSLGIAYFIAFM